jgi:hypothetical protein
LQILEESPGFSPIIDLKSKDGETFAVF